MENETSQDTTQDVLFSEETEKENEKTEDSEQTEKEENSTEQGKETSEEAEQWEIERSEQSKLSNEAFKDLVDFAKENGVSKDFAQELIDRAEQREVQIMSGIEEKRIEMINQWAEDSKNDPEIGGEKLKEHAELARRALNEFGSESLTEGLKSTGYGNHPELIKFFAKVGKLIADDQIITGDKGANQLTAAEVLYNNKGE